MEYDGIVNSTNNEVFKNIINPFLEIIKKIPRDDKLENINNRYSDILNYDFPTNDSELNYYKAMYLIYIAEFTIEYKNYFSSSFHKINHIHFYNLAYCFAVISILSDDSLSELVSAVNFEMANISFQKLKNDKDLIEDMANISEHEFYEIIKDLSLNEICDIIEIINAERETKTQLKLYVINKQEDEFIMFLLKNNIIYDKAASYAQLWTSIKSEVQLSNKIINKIDTENLEFDDLKEECYNFKAYISNNSNYTNETFINDSIKLIEKIELLNDEISLEVFPSLYTHYYQSIAVLISNHKILGKHCCNMKCYFEIQDIIDNNSLLKSIEETLLNNECDYTKIHAYITTLNKFKELYLNNLIIPANNFKKRGIRKNENDYFIGKNIESYDSMYLLYKTLTKYDYLDWNNNTCTTFLYRMTPEYIPENITPIIIIWKGEPKDLISLIWHFHEGCSKVWKKLETFFHLQYGQKIKINGAKNQTAFSKKMKQVINEYERLKLENNI